MVRLIGPDCFKSLNKDAHIAAEQEFHAEQRRRREVQYLRGNAVRLRAVGQLISDALDTAEAIDRFGQQLRHKVDDLLDMGLWKHVKTGELSVWTAYRELSGRTGDVREVSRSQVYARIEGFLILKPNLKSYRLALRTIIQLLAQLDDIERWNARVDEMSEKERFKACRVINNAVKSAKAVFEEMRDLQKFVEPVNINTLNKWGAREDCQRPTFANRVGSTINIGRNPAALLHIMIPPRFDTPIPEIDAPLLRDMDEAAEV